MEQLLCGREAELRGCPAFEAKHCYLDTKSKHIYLGFFFRNLSSFCMGWMAWISDAASVIFY